MLVYDGNSKSIIKTRKYFISYTYDLERIKIVKIDLLLGFFVEVKISSSVCQKYRVFSRHSSLEYSIGSAKLYFSR